MHHPRRACNAITVQHTLHPTQLAWTHLAPAPEGAAQQPLPQPTSSASSSSEGGGAGAAAAAADGGAPGLAQQGARLQLELERYSCAELVELVRGGWKGGGQLGGYGWWRAGL